MPFPLERCATGAIDSLTDPELFGSLPQACAFGLEAKQFIGVHDPRGRLSCLPQASIPCTRAHPLPDQVTLQLSDGPT